MGDIYAVPLKDLQNTLFSDREFTKQYVQCGKFMWNKKQAHTPYKHRIIYFYRLVLSNRTFYGVGNAL